MHEREIAVESTRDGGLRATVTFSPSIRELPPYLRDREIEIGLCIAQDRLREETERVQLQRVG